MTSKVSCFYNESNLASLINEAREMEELIDSSTLFLSKTNKKIKTHFSKVLEQRHSTRNFCIRNHGFINILKYHTVFFWS